MASLLALALVTVGVPVVLIAFGVYPHGLPSIHDAWNSLKTQDTTGQYFHIAAGAAVWIAWAVYTVLTIKETASAVRHHGRLRPIPTTGLRQIGPAALVAAVTVMFLAAPALHSASAAAAPPATSNASVPSAWAPAARSSTAPSPPHTEPIAPPTSAAGPPVPAATYTVQRYDTLWGIAARHLPGDPAQRWHDLQRLNPQAVGPDNTIQPGAVLTLPADAHGLTPHPAHVTSRIDSVPVTAGDTLSGISAEHGNPDWHTVWPLNAGRAEPRGERFTDPDHIEPGWTVAEPVAVEPVAAGPSATAQTAGAPPTGSTPPVTGPTAPIPAPARPSTKTAPPTPQSDPAPRTDSPAPQREAPAPAPRAGTATATTAAVTSVGDEADRAVTIRDAVYAGGGVLLAAGILSALVAQRRRQFRNRRPGRMISSPPAELVPTEKALLANGARGAADIAFLHFALRGLSAATAEQPDGQLPEIAAVRMIGDQLELRVSEPHPAAPPAPWVVDDSGYWWSVNIDDELPVTEDNADQVMAPYPTLVAVGMEPAGATWLLDLEAAGALALTGDPARCLDLGRFLAAELAVNAWSDQLTVTLLGFGAELVPLKPERIRQATDLATAAADLTDHLTASQQAAQTVDVDILTGRSHAIAGDMWMPHVLIVGPDAARQDPDGEILNRLLADLRDGPGRSAAAVVLAGDQPAAEHARHIVALDSDGTLTLPGLGVTLTAQQLPAQRASDLSRLVDLAGHLDDVPMPPSHGSTPLAEFIDAAGGLLPEVGAPRSPAAAQGHPGGESSANPDAGAAGGDTDSVLPDDDASYLHDGATTPEDLQAIAPRVDAARRAQILAADPRLDDDLADWLDPTSARPKLQLLGPLKLTACGGTPPKRIAYYTEVAAYIGTRDNGATAEQIADAFNVSTKTMYSRISELRDWLGADPVTGQKYLPDATQSPHSKARGVGVYEFRGGLIDADLFVRLRARATIGGPDGLYYLQAALDLVTGPPFFQPRGGGYEWLADTKLDQVLTASIGDAAHTAHQAYLRAGDLPAAQAAAETGLRADPYGHTAKLDLTAVMKTRGFDAEGDRYLREDVCNDAPRGEAPDDLPERTQEILRRRAWLTRAS